MKIITILIYIIGFQYIASAQNTSRVSRQPLKAGTSKSKIGYVLSHAGPETAGAKTDIAIQNNDVVITGLPALTRALTSVNIELEMLGSFTFMPAASLRVPYNCEVFIEDKLTGKMFNLKSAVLYTFNADEHMANRFVLHVLDKNSPGTLVTSGVIRGNKVQS